MHAPKTNSYEIGYTPPLAIRDEPHRLLDTIGGFDSASCECGTVTEVGEPVESTVECLEFEGTLVADEGA